MSIALGINDNYQRENKELKEKVRDAEGETSIVKAVGMNSPEMRALHKEIEELDKSLSIALEINDNYQRENKELKEKVRNAEGETSIVKAVGVNSPEMRALQKEVEELKADLVRAKEDHQYDNLVHQKELESLRKK